MRRSPSSCCASVRKTFHRPVQLSICHEHVVAERDPFWNRAELRDGPEPLLVGASRVVLAVTAQAQRHLLEQAPGTAAVQHRHVPTTAAAAITETVDRADALVWYQGALGELQATLAAQHLEAASAAGGIFGDALFTDDRGEATIFVPCNSTPRPMGRVAALDIPPVELAAIVHVGSHTGIDQAYGALGAHVARHALGVDGPIREYYLVGPTDTDDETRWRTEVGWPIFQTRPSA